MSAAAAGMMLITRQPARRASRRRTIAAGPSPPVGAAAADYRHRRDQGRSLREEKIAFRRNFMPELARAGGVDGPARPAIDEPSSPLCRTEGRFRRMSEDRELILERLGAYRAPPTSTLSEYDACPSSAIAF